VRPRERRGSAFDRSARPRKHRPDYTLILLSLTLLVIGLIVIYAISPGLVALQGVSENYYISKQIIAIMMGLAAFGITATVPIDRWKTLSKPLIVAAIVAAVAVQLFGEEVNGAYRWIQVGGISFQAAELIKFALVIWLAGFLTERIKKGEMNNHEKTFKPILVALAAIGVVVAFMQSDLGSAGVMVAIIAAMCFVAGLPLKKVLMFGGIIALGVSLLIAISPYRRDRVFTFMNPERDCQAAGYQACQALIAVGSGGLFGKGLAHSVQAYGYLPEAANDSIFAIFAEKFGFVGVAVLLSLLMAIFTRLVIILERAPDTFSRLIVAGALAWLSTQSIINIGAMIGLLPLKGITLPYISYGGTSIIFVVAVTGLIFNISRYTTYNINTVDEGERAYENPANRRGDRRAYYAPFGRRS
jgi:cell division protein FtsW